MAAEEKPSFIKKAGSWLAEHKTILLIVGGGVAAVVLVYALVSKLGSGGSTTSVTLPPPNTSPGSSTGGGGGGGGGGGNTQPPAPGGGGNTQPPGGGGGGGGGSGGGGPTIAQIEDSVAALDQKFFNYLDAHPGATIGTSPFLASLHKKAQALRSQLPGAAPSGGYTAQELASQFGLTVQPPAANATAAASSSPATTPAKTLMAGLDTHTGPSTAQAVKSATTKITHAADALPAQAQRALAGFRGRVVMPKLSTSKPQVSPAHGTVSQAAHAVAAVPAGISRALSYLHPGRILAVKAIKPKYTAKAPVASFVAKAKQAAAPVQIQRARQIFRGGSAL